MIHGWPLLSAALTAGVLLWGRVGHHVKREASRFIPSTLSTDPIDAVVLVQQSAYLFKRDSVNVQQSRA
jgi:hypothetical protein